MKIGKETYENNLLFYSILKCLLKCRLTKNKMVQLEKLIKDNINLSSESLLEYITSQIVGENATGYDACVSLINLYNVDNHLMWCDLTILSINLLFAKDLILSELKTYENDTSESHKDKLSFEYDLDMLEKPYSQRVISAMLVYLLTDVTRNNELFLESSGFLIENLSDLVKKAEEEYHINVNNVFMTIMDESLSQSIKSKSGASYETRVSDILYCITNEVKSHVHDKYIPSVEYDFTFVLNGKTYGVNAKRTLRERYKQNFEDVNNLSVEAVFLITLGIDLNEEKLNNIMQRHGYFVVVAQEVYDSHSYFKKNKRVISSKNFNKEFLEKLFNQFI